MWASFRPVRVRGPVEGSENRIDSSFHCFLKLAKKERKRLQGKSQDIKLTERPRHSHAKDDAGKGAFGRTFAKGEHQPADHDGNQGEAGCDGAGEGCLQDLNCLVQGSVGAA